MPIGFGGRNLGFAHGRIRIDTSEAQRAVTTMRRIGRDIRQSMDSIGGAGASIGQRIGSGLRSAGRNLQDFSRQIEGLRGELIAVGAAGAILSKIGLEGARNIRNYRVTFSQLLGDEQKAAELMRQLTDQANEFGIEVTEVWQLARALLPALEGNTEELDEFVKRAALLASTNPLKSTADAARAIQEFLAGQTISLQRLFNVDPNLIQEAQDRFEGVGEQLDFILSRMGATEEGAKQMADAWVGVKNELKLLLAEGFTPLLETLRPLLTQFREFVSEIRQSNPAIAKVGAGLIAIAAVGAPTLLFFGQMISSLQKIKGLIDALNLARFAGGLGRLGAIGAVAAGGVALGIGATRAIGRATGREDLANANAAQLWQQIRQILFVIVSGLSEVGVQIGNLLISAAQRFMEVVAAMANGAAGFVRFIGNVLPDELGGGKLREVADGLEKFSEGLRETAERGGVELRDRLRDQQKDFLSGVLGFLGLSGGDAAAAGGGLPGGSSIGAPGGGGAAADERAEAMREFNEELRRIEENRLKQTADAIKQFHEQRNDTIRQFNQTMAREEEDFNRQRRRQNERLQSDIDRINAERVEREAEWQQKLTDRIAELRADSTERLAELQEDGNERIADIEEDFQRDRERRERQHRNNLLTAASRLDARAIAEEQRRFREQNREADDQFEDRVKSEKESLQERLEQEQENLQERIEQEQEGHQERLLQAREADRERIEDMRAALAEQQRIEDEDRAIRLQRAREDHAAQLQEQHSQHLKRLQQIQEQAAEERALLAEQFEEKLDMLKEQHEAETTVTQGGTPGGTIRPIGRDPRGPISGGGGLGGSLGGFQRGGAVYDTGLAMLHGSRSRPEFVLDPDTTATLRGMLGNFTQAGLVGAVSGGRSTSVNMAPGAIQIHAAPGQSEEMIGNVVMSKLEAFFRSVVS